MEDDAEMRFRLEYKGRRPTLGWLFDPERKVM
jgi:hypothetical protein